MEEQNPSLNEHVVTFLEEALLPGVSHHPVEKSAAPTVGAQSQDRLAQGSGIRTQPGGKHGADVPAPAMDTLTANIIIGPYTLGKLIATFNFDNLTTMLVLGSAVNISVTGWVINSIAQRASPLDPFGLLVSGVSQVGMGAVFDGLPATRPKQK